jgi:hypothetical protein
LTATAATAISFGRPGGQNREIPAATAATPINTRTGQASGVRGPSVVDNSFEVGERRNPTMAFHSVRNYSAFGWLAEGY